jgi:tyrosyl-tRNA synthetase
MMPILAGTDGVEKMSKSLDNYIGINDPPREIFGKTMRIPDTLIVDYFTLTTDVSASELAQIRKELADPNTNPSLLKRRLARALVTLYHNAGAAAEAEREFDRMFRDREAPEDIQEATVNAANGGVGILQLLVETNLVGSKSEARRMIDQGAVTIDGTRVSDQNTTVMIGEGIIVRVGKRNFRRVRRA